MHHLRPEDVTVNCARGNNDFDNGGTRGGPVHRLPAATRDSFEPRDAVKGDVARMIFYMAIRYEGGDGWPDLEPNESVEQRHRARTSASCRCSSSGTPRTRRTPSRSAATRSSTTQCQHNRNPFIDHPEWVTSIFGP